MTPVVPDGEEGEVALLDSQPYKVTFASPTVRGSFVGWFSESRSTYQSLYFHGEVGGEWFLVKAKAVKSAEVIE